MKKLTTNEWVAVVVALVVIGVFMIFPQIIASNKLNPNAPQIPSITTSVESF